MIVAPRRMATPNRPRDPNQLAKLIVDLSTCKATESDPNAEKDPAAVLRGRLRGLQGGQARSEAPSSRKRKQIVKKAASACWSKKYFYPFSAVSLALQLTESAEMG